MAQLPHWQFCATACNHRMTRVAEDPARRDLGRPPSSLLKDLLKLSAPMILMGYHTMSPLQACGGGWALCWGSRQRGLACQVTKQRHRRIWTASAQPDPQVPRSTGSPRILQLRPCMPMAYIGCPVASCALFDPCSDASYLPAVQSGHCNLSTGTLRAQCPCSWPFEKHVTRRTFSGLDRTIPAPSRRELQPGAVNLLCS